MLFRSYLDHVEPEELKTLGALSVDINGCLLYTSEVTATGAGIQVPVGEQTLGRLFNVLGETIDNGEPITDSKKWVIHRQPPTFEDQSPVVEILETGIKVIDLLAPYAKGGKILSLIHI